MTDSLIIRAASAADADMIADLHARSWASAYRGVMDDAYLDGPVHDERRAAWRERYAGEANFVVFVAESGGKPCGFISWFPDADPDWGGLIDNFHMAPDEKGKGLGRKLLAEVMRLSAIERPGQGLWLTVLEGNAAAQKAYDRLGGRPMGRFEKISGDGAAHPVIRYVWSAPRTEGHVGQMVQLDSKKRKAVD